MRGGSSGRGGGGCGRGRGGGGGADGDPSFHPAARTPKLVKTVRLGDNGCIVYRVTSIPHDPDRIIVSGVDLLAQVNIATGSLDWRGGQTNLSTPKCTKHWSGPPTIDSPDVSVAQGGGNKLVVRSLFGGAQSLQMYDVTDDNSVSLSGVVALPIKRNAHVFHAMNPFWERGGVYSSVQQSTLHSFRCSGGKLALGGGDGDVVVHAPPGMGWTSVKFDPSGQFVLAACCGARTSEVWLLDAVTLKMIHRLTKKGSDAACWSPCGRFVATVGEGSTSDDDGCLHSISVWDATSGELLNEIKWRDPNGPAHRGRITDISFAERPGMLIARYTAVASLSVHHLVFSAVCSGRILLTADVTMQEGRLSRMLPDGRIVAYFSRFGGEDSGTFLEVYEC